MKILWTIIKTVVYFVLILFLAMFAGFAMREIIGIVTGLMGVPIIIGEHWVPPVALLIAVVAVLESVFRKRKGLRKVADSKDPVRQES